MKRRTGDDPWGRSSYDIPDTAVLGCSCTGEAGPAPASSAKAEISAFQEHLRATSKIESKLEQTKSGNLFMVKVWVVVPKRHYAKACTLATAYLATHKDDTYLIHDAKS